MSDARRDAEAALDGLGQPGLRDLVERAEAGDRALACLTVAQQRDTLSVLRLLAEEGAYGARSAASPHLRETFARLVRWGLTAEDGTRWKAVTVTGRGRHLLSSTWAPPLKKKGS